MESENKKGIAGALWKMYTDEEEDVSSALRCTVKVQCGQSWVTFRPHKLVLMLWSFAFEESLAFNNVITITDFRPSVIEATIKFLYGLNKVVESNEKDPLFLLDLYKAGEIFEIQELRNQCCRVLHLSAVNYKNVFEVLKAADYMKMNTLKLQCIRVLTTETVEVLSSLDLQDVTPFEVNAILNLPELSLSSEAELLFWVFEWAEMEVERASKEERVANLHLLTIHPFLPLLNFTALDAETFARLVDKHKKFFNENECFYIFMNILCPDTTVNLPSWLNKSGIAQKYNDEVKKANSATIDDEDCSHDFDDEGCPQDFDDKDCSQRMEEAICKSHNGILEENASQENSVSHSPHDSQADEAFKRHMDESDASKSAKVECNDESTIEYDSDSSFVSLKVPKMAKKKIKKKKLKTHYLVPDYKRGVFSSCHSWSTQYSSGDFDSLVEEVWKQQKFTSLRAGA